MLGIEHQRLLIELALRNAFALRQRLFVALLAGLFEAAQLAVDAVEQGARFAQRALGAYALAQRGLVFVFQCFHRRIAFAQLGDQIFQARIELPALAVHAFQGLAQRCDLGALRLQRQRQCMHCIAHAARGISRLIACIGELTALAFQRFARALQIAHQGDRVFEFGARFACLLAAGIERFQQLRQFGFDALDARARRVHLALLTLQLPSQFGDAAVRHIQLALRVFALLLCRQQLFAEAGQLVLKLGFALLQGFDLGAQLLDLALTQQRALLGRARARDPHPTLA